MKMIDLLEKDKENLLVQLSASKYAAKAIIVLENELDKLLLMYNEKCSSEQERNSAAYMMQAIRLSLPFIDSIGETKVWETGSVSGGTGYSKSNAGTSGGTGYSKSSAGRGGKLNPLMFLFLAAGLVFCGISIASLIAAASDAGKNLELFKLITLELGGLAAVLIAGLIARRRPPKIDTNRSYKVDVQVDPSKIYRNFRNAILSVDQNLQEIRSMERWDKRDEAGLIDGHKASSSELELFSDLLAAAYSGDPEYALEKIEEIKYYLHRQQIEVVDYSEKTAQFFDMMPGQFAGTIRPALIADGTLLKKGIASKGAN